MKLSVCLAVIAIGAAATAANAETSYSGFRVEAEGGWDRAGVKAETRLEYDGNVYEFEGEGGHDGLTYGIRLGYDGDLGDGLLLGVEAGINWSSMKYCTNGESGCIKAGREIEAGIRLGQQLGNNGPLVYGKIAYVNGRAASLYYGAGHNNRNGFRLGVGIEQKLSQRIYVKAEYRYTAFNSYEFIDADSYTRLALDKNQLVGGVGLLF